MNFYLFNLANASELHSMCSKRARHAKGRNRRQWRKEANMWQNLRKAMMSGEVTG